MKKILLTTLIAGALAGTALGQGSVAFSATSAHGLISYSTDGSTKVTLPAGNPAQVSTFGQLNLAAYSAVAGTANPFTASSAGLLPAAWVQSANVWHQIAPLPGNTPAVTWTLPNSAGNDSVQFMIVGWTGNYATWNEAYNAGQASAGTVLMGWTGSTLSGGALSWSQGTGAPAGSPPTAAVVCTYGAAGFAGLSLGPVGVIPEPTTFALAGLGAAALLIFRRRR